VTGAPSRYRFLADENVPMPSVVLLRAAGLDVTTIVEDAAGVDDGGVLARARRAGRILLTFDRDHGDLIFRQGRPAPPGVIYLRTGQVPPTDPGERVLASLAEPDSPIVPVFTILEERRTRRRLPATGGGAGWEW
jgi:predicted nuclease of predicted toxin-antitoxin system